MNQYWMYPAGVPSTEKMKGRVVFAPFDHVANIIQLLLRLTPPIADMRLLEPAPHQRQVAGGHGMEIIAGRFTVRHFLGSR